MTMLLPFHPCPLTVPLTTHAQPVSCTLSPITTTHMVLPGPYLLWPISHALPVTISEVQYQGTLESDVGMFRVVAMVPGCH